MKKILVPTDFSDCAEKALRYAVYIAKKMGAEIILLHVCELLDDKFTRFKTIIREYNEAKTMELTQSLKRLVRYVEKDRVLITTDIYDGKIIDAILTASRQHGADIIVMGTMGATGLKTVLGTKAAAVINKSLIPVITVPSDYKSTGLKEILIAINNTKQFSEIYKPVFGLSRVFGANVKTVIFTEEKANAVKMIGHSKVVGQIRKLLEKQFPDTEVDAVHIYGQDFHRTIQKHVKKQKTDLLVMVTHERTFIRNLFKRSMTRQMAYDITIPLMSIKGSNF